MSELTTWTPPPAGVQQLGGRVHVPPTDIPNVSRFSIVADPQMATLALIKGARRRREAIRAAGAPGHVVWHELLASNWERAFTFYNALLGWQKAGVHAGPMGAYQEFSDGTETIGGMFTPPEMQGFSVWVFYFSVRDIEAAAKSVRAGGGRILYGPITVPGSARIVHCLDPQGAVFGLMDRRVRVSIGCYAPRDPHG